MTTDEQLDALLIYVEAAFMAKAQRDRGHARWCPDLWTTRHLRHAARKPGQA